MAYRKGSITMHDGIFGATQLVNYPLCHSANVIEKIR